MCGGALCVWNDSHIQCRIEVPQEVNVKGQCTAMEGPHEPFVAIKLPHNITMTTQELACSLSLLVVKQRLANNNNLEESTTPQSVSTMAQSCQPTQRCCVPGVLQADA